MIFQLYGTASHIRLNYSGLRFQLISCNCDINCQRILRDSSLLEYIEKLSPNRKDNCTNEIITSHQFD